MKQQIRILAWIAVSVASFSFSAFARDTFKISWRGTVYITDANGVVTLRPFTQQDIVNKISADNGLDPRTQVLVYVHDEEEPAEELEVVPLANGKITTANVYQFLEGTIVSNPAGTLTERHRFIFDEYHGTATGSIFGTEKLKRNANGSIAAFSYHGKFIYSLPDENKVFVGTFSTGKRILP